MIEYVDERCKEWAKAVCSDGGHGTSIIAALIDGGGVLSRSTASSVPFSPDVQEIEKIILELPPVWLLIVKEQYLGRGNSVENAQAVGVTKKFFYFRLDDSHKFIGDRLRELADA